MIGRIVNESDTKPGHIGELCQTEQELGATAAAFRSVIQIDDKLLQTAKAVFSPLPPEKKAVDNEVTGFAAGAEK